MAISCSGTAFQYPLSGRVWWSDVELYALENGEIVSVPSVGSGLVEQLVQKSSSAPLLVSVPSVGSGLVERSAAHVRPVDVPVSVPSVGSGLVERRPRMPSKIWHPFQYPLSGRVWWSLVRLFAAGGSSSFSTLCRVGFGGAGIISSLLSLVACFSTLCRVGFGGARFFDIVHLADTGFSTLCRVGFGGAKMS